MTTRPSGGRGRIDASRLRDLCGRPLARVSGDELLDLVAELGPIGELWLRPEVFEKKLAWQRECNRQASKAGDWSPPRLERGQIGILLTTASAESLPLLRPAFVLPVEWRRGGESSQLLPSGLVAVAASALEDLEIRNLSLHPAGWLEEAGCDFSAFPFSSDSAWAALAAGAIVANERGLTHPDVLVTAAWKRETIGRSGRILRVTGLAEKTAAAALAGASVVIMPRENEVDVDELPAEHPARRLDIQYLPNLSCSPRAAIVEVLRRIQEMPRRDTVRELEPRCLYYMRLDTESNDGYYCDHILPDIVEKLTAAVRADARLAAVDGVVMIASRSRSLALVVAGIYGNARVLLLHDKALVNDVPDLCERIAAAVPEGCPRRSVKPVLCGNGDAFAEDAKKAVKDFAAGCSRLVVDLTAGYRDYMFALLSSLPENAVATYVMTQQTGEFRSPDPQTSALRVVSLPGRD